MAHGDDAGLRLPPRLAPVQVVVVLVRDDDTSRRSATALAADLGAAGHRVRLDDRVGISFGRRSIDWELKGVPVRVEVGPRDLASGQVVLVRRDIQVKRTVAIGGVVAAVSDELAASQNALHAEAAARQAARTHYVSTPEEAAAAASEGFAVLPWASLGPDGEEQLAAGGFSVRCLQAADGTLAAVDDEPGLRAVVAKAY